MQDPARQPWHPATARAFLELPVLALKEHGAGQVPLKGLFLIATNLNLPRESQQSIQAFKSLPTQVRFGEGKHFRSKQVSSLHDGEAPAPRTVSRDDTTASKYGQDFI